MDIVFTIFAYAFVVLQWIAYLAFPVFLMYLIYKLVIEPFILLFKKNKRS